jgi:beta-aspartyl-dipeptidase (metallo-type)
MPGLLARVKGLNDGGITAYCYSGGYSVPPRTVTGSIRDDILLIQEIIGAGEICISDERSTDPQVAELARLVSDANIGGMLSGKAGVSHFHVGPRPKRLSLLRQLLDKFDIQPEWLYPTHVGRNEELMDEAIELVKRGVTVDIDVVEKDLPQWLGYYMERGGNLHHVTVSSDSFRTGPQNLLDQLRQCVLEHGFQLDSILPTVTSNTARILKLASKGQLAEGMDADVVLLDRASLELTDLIARGQRLMCDGRILNDEPALSRSDRRIKVAGGHMH